MTSAAQKADFSWKRSAPRLLPLALVVALALVAASRGSATYLVPEDAFAAPSLRHPFGCAETGIDFAALLGVGLLRGLGLAVVVALFGFSVGTTVGVGAALRGGALERVLLRTCDLLQAFPSFLLAMVLLSAVRAPSRVHLACVFAVTAWAPFARLAAMETRVLRGAAFVEASLALGRGLLGTARVHILPNVLPTVAVQLGASAAATIVGEAGLAFVGFGPRDGVSLGGALDQAVAGVFRAPLLLGVARLAVFLGSAALVRASTVFSPRKRG